MYHGINIKRRGGRREEKEWDGKSQAKVQVRLGAEVWSEEW